MFAKDSRLDLFNRKLKVQSARLKSRAVELLPRGLRTPKGGGILLIGDEDDDGSQSREVRGRGEKYKREVEREVERIKVKVRRLRRASNHRTRIKLSHENGASLRQKLPISHAHGVRLRRYIPRRKSVRLYRRKKPLTELKVDA